MSVHRPTRPLHRPRQHHNLPLILFLTFATLILGTGLFIGPVASEILVSETENHPGALRQSFTRNLVALARPRAFAGSTERTSTLQAFLVKSNDTPAGIARRLTEAKLISRPIDFLLPLYQNGLETDIQAGTYQILPTSSTADMVALLRHSKGEFVTLRVIEGWRLSQIALEVEKVFGIPAAAFTKAAVVGPYNYAYLTGVPAGTTLEGYLWPDTYYFPPEATATDVIKTMLLNFDRRVGPALIKAASKRSVTVSEIVAIASIVEREAAVNSERGTIASVYWNRVARHMKFEADPTVQYALGSWRELTLADLKIDSPYNTYLNPGFPPTAICSSGEASLLAAANPEQTPYLFFVARGDGSGEHLFAETAAAHEANRIKVGNKKP